MKVRNKKDKQLFQASDSHDHFETKEKADDYLQYYSQDNVSQIKKRADHYKKIANHYYDLVTDFYEYGWGSSFHFGFPYHGESYEAAIRRLEFTLAHALKVEKGHTILDIGCGIGGPMREIARFTGAKIIGINNNTYQITKGDQYNKDCHLDSLCSFIKADMQHLPLEDNSYDGAYTLEAMCYAPDQAKAYAEIFRVLKPGAYLAGTDWCMTESYDAKNKNHFRLKEKIAKGNGLYDLLPCKNVLISLEKAGFEIIEYRDLAAQLNSPTPWYLPLAAKWSFKGFRRTSIGRFVTKQTARSLEWLHFLPRGTSSVMHFLNEGADSLVEAGQLGIFTPGFFFIVKKG